MNNFQYNSSPKIFHSPITVTKKRETQERSNQEKKTKEEGKAKKKQEWSKGNKSLKIYFESEILNQNESRFEWKKKPSLEKILNKKEVKKNWKNGRPSIKTDKFGTEIPNTTQAKRGKNSNQSKPHPAIRVVSKSKIMKNHINKKYGKALGSENVKDTSNVLFELRRSKLETAKKKDDKSIPPSSSNIGQTTSKTFPQKHSNKNLNIKTTTSECRKNHINEILRGHAQQIQTHGSKSGQQFKDCSFQSVTELLQKVQNITNIVTVSKERDSKYRKYDYRSAKEKLETKEKVEAKEKVETKEKAEKTEREEKTEKDDKTADTKEKDEKKGDTVNLAGKEGQGSKKAINEEETESLKKLGLKWLKQPQLDFDKKPEVDQVVFFPKNLIFEASNLNDMEKEKKQDEGTEAIVEKIMEEEANWEKKEKFIDRLLSRASDKEKEEKVIESKKTIEKQERKERKEKKEEGLELGTTNDIVIGHAIVDTKPLGQAKDHLDNRELLSIKDGRSSDSEQIYKAKASRSTELKDLVTQAVKEHKIFCIFDNHWYIVRPVREELLSRGWLEVIPDRRLIPRRRPPPMGPTYDREKNPMDRNCNAIEAVLTARETFADEIQETVSKSSSFKITMESAKNNQIIVPIVNKKFSEESLPEVHSHFRIVPPTPEKKKNNVEIREFVTKCQTTSAKEKEKKAKEKEKTPKNSKKLKNKSSEQNIFKFNLPDKGSKVEENAIAQKKSFSINLQSIMKTVDENNQMLLKLVDELDEKIGKPKTLGILCKKGQEVEEKDAEEKKDGENSEEAEKNSKLIFSDNESKIISKLIQSTNARIHFMWLSIKPGIHLKCFNYSPEIVNKFQKTSFCTKIGLWSHLNNIQWYAHEVHFPAKSPRMYNTGEPDDLQAFFQDFQITACIGMLKWLSDTFFDKGIKAVQTKKGKVPLKAFEFAIKQCERYIRFKENEDLALMDGHRANQEEWNTFLQWFYIITNDHGKVQESSTAQLMVVYTKAVETLRTMKRHWPEIEIDGRLNIWIMKPYCASCGRGIFMTNNVYYIGQHSKYIVQKYIEKPLLIYNTKFDIRQWFMITKLTPLEIWMYKESYLRFCTQPFALRNLHESVHLSNNSVQRKYISVRDPTLPDQNMWDSETFQIYLKTIGHPTTWQDIIYPGMKDAIVSTMLAAQDTFDGPRKSWFEVYGADFMLSANLKDGPWLIEINENPAMDPSTKVTARLCPQMLRDVIKVVVDKRNNKNASTGQWELVYRQNYSPSFGTVDLDVRGRKIARVPHSLKLDLNLGRRSPNSTASGKAREREEVDFSKPYEVVKSFGSGYNLKSDITSLTGKRLRDKLKKPSKDQTKDFSVIPLEQKNTISLYKEKIQKNLQTLENLENKNSSYKKEPSEKEKVENVQDNAKVKAKDVFQDFPQKQGKNEKSSVYVASSAARLGVRTITSFKDMQKNPSLGLSGGELLKKTFNFEKQSPTTENKSITGSLNPFSNEVEKFKFSKLYKV